MKGILYSAAAVALVWGLTSPSTGNAATLNLLGTDGASVSASGGFPTNPTLITGAVEGKVALAFTSDWVEFSLSPPPPNPQAFVTVNFLTTAIYPGEEWQIVESTPTGMVEASGTADNLTHTITLSDMYDYYLEFYSSAAPTKVGDSQFTIQAGGNTASTPIPGTVALFAGGLGLLGATGLRRRKKLPLALSA